LVSTNAVLVSLVCISLSCQEEAHPVYNEGEIVWQPTTGEELGIEAEPHLLSDNTLVYLNRGALCKRNISSGNNAILAPRAYSIDISPNEQWIAFNSSYSSLRTVKLDGDSLKTLANVGGNTSATWMHDSKHLVYQHSINDPLYDQNGLWNLDIYTGERKFMFAGANEPDVFEDGSKVLGWKSVSNTAWHRFAIFDLKTGHELKSIDAAKNQDNISPKISPDGGWIVFRNVNGIYLVDVNGKQLTLILPTTHFYEIPLNGYLGFRVTNPSWHPDGEHIVFEHLEINYYEKCKGYCTEQETINGIVSIRKLKVK
jgi:Tol biopolymer transport system component